MRTSAYTVASTSGPIVSLPSLFVPRMQARAQRKSGYTAAAPTAGAIFSLLSALSSQLQAPARRKSACAAAVSRIAAVIVSLPDLASPLMQSRAGRKSAYAIAAVLVAAAIVSLLSLFSPQVQARAPENTIAEITPAKGDRLDMQRLGTDCSQREWPYFEAACMRNASNWAAAVRQPRVVSVDRLPQDGGAMVAAR